MRGFHKDGKEKLRELKHWTVLKMEDFILCTSNSRCFGIDLSLFKIVRKTYLDIKYKYFSYVQRIFEWFNKFDKVLTR